MGGGRESKEEEGPKSERKKEEERKTQHEREKKDVKNSFLKCRKFTLEKKLQWNRDCCS
jgi:hypothetical protein